ncbi:MAG: hypothetical protein AAGB13_11405 [Cyanobacteria bacterium P01_F01_bin.33]
MNLPSVWVVREVTEDWQLGEPEGASVETFRQIRDEAIAPVQTLLQSLHSNTSN